MLLHTHFPGVQKIMLCTGVYNPTEYLAISGMYAKTADVSTDNE